eukprot:4801192-Prymnesium_polylepis.2
MAVRDEHQLHVLDVTGWTLRLLRMSRSGGRPSAAHLPASMPFSCRLFRSACQCCTTPGTQK